MKQLILILSLLCFSWSVSGQITRVLENKSNTNLIDSILISSNTLYNSGIDYYNEGSIGKSIWAFESALKLDQSNENISHNLNLVQDEYHAQIEMEHEGIDRWFAQNIYKFDPNFWFYLSLFSTALTVIGLYLFFTPTSRLLNHISLFCVTLFGITLLISTSFSFLHKNYLSSTNNAVIINNVTHILSEPTIGSDISFSVQEGSQLKIITTQDDWFELKLYTKSGWILKDSVWVY